jgi:hypothetical protein
MPDTTTPPPVATEREAFEARIKKSGWCGRDIDRNGRDEYIEEGTALAWELWQEFRAALPAPAVAPVTDEWHCTNEWADMATSGLQWLRNVRDGVSTTGDAIANMEQLLAHCQQVGASQHPAVAPSASPAQGGEAALLAAAMKHPGVAELASVTAQQPSGDEALMRQALSDMQRARAYILDDIGAGNVLDDGIKKLRARLEGTKEPTNG